MNKYLLDRSNKGAWVSIASISSNWSDNEDHNEASALERDFEDTVDHSGRSATDAWSTLRRNIKVTVISEQEKKTGVNMNLIERTRNRWTDGLLF